MPQIRTHSFLSLNRKTKTKADMYGKSVMPMGKGNPFDPKYVRANRRTVEPWDMTAYVNDIIVKNLMDKCKHCTWSPIEYRNEGGCYWRLKFVNHLCQEHERLLNTYTHG